MITITTPRLSLEPTHKNCWSIYNKSGEDLLGKLFFHNNWFNIILKPKSLHLGVATEAGYGLIKAINSQTVKAKTDLPHAQLYLRNMGFKPVDGHYEVSPDTLKMPNLYERINKKLGIDIHNTKVPRYPTATQIVDAGVDCFDRPFKMHPHALKAWQSMQQAASQEGVSLLAVSAYRSLNYQGSLIQKKLDQGQSLNDILKVNTPPGHSEHHTGCALDISTQEESELLQESFAETQAYSWLTNNAATFGFKESYPEQNPYGMIAEPWHWCFNLNESERI